MEFDKKERKYFLIAAIFIISFLLIKSLVCGIYAKGICKNLSNIKIEKGELRYIPS